MSWAATMPPANIDGTIELKSDDNTFDIWENIQDEHG